MDKTTPIPPQTSTTAISDIEELTITLAIRNFNPTLLSYELLTMSGIVPTTWELANQPVVNPRISQVSFKNGVNIVAQGNTISFLEAVANKPLGQLQFAQVALQYIDKMSNAEYQAISFTPRLVIPLSAVDEDAGKDFINQTFLNTGPWQHFGHTTPQTALSLFYELDNCRFSLNINPARLQQPDNSFVSAVLFVGSFNYPLPSNTSDILSQLRLCVNSWPQDLHTFHDFVYQKILQRAIPPRETLFNL
ncbi:MAG: hypothetical protein NZ901_10880 [Geminocystis sp.]|nr:hypothetical protein [Geminocystis sp.]HIK38185.1 hypothetical protein [Geminocystis sp. M7585_C2015_104]MCS7148677.1 hypothetical protein [Geminocystis sp.]MCX8078207.1 hypothetical protein [Geminocystis sp.]MDW8115093.1 hypothetical protein [Geminocystis sp.]